MFSYTAICCYRVPVSLLCCAVLLGFLFQQQTSFPRTLLNWTNCFNSYMKWDSNNSALTCGHSQINVAFNHISLISMVKFVSLFSPEPEDSCSKWEFTTKHAHTHTPQISHIFTHTKIRKDPVSAWIHLHTLPCLFNSCFRICVFGYSLYIYRLWIWVEDLAPSLNMYYTK